MLDTGPLQVGPSDHLGGALLHDKMDSQDGGHSDPGASNRGAGFVPPVLVMSGSDLVQLPSPQVTPVTAQTGTAGQQAEPGTPTKFFIPGLHFPSTVVKTADENVNVKAYGQGLKVKEPDAKPHSVEYITIMTSTKPLTIPIKVVKPTSTVGGTAKGSSGPPASGVSYVSGENRAPYEIEPIPGKVKEDKGEYRDGKYVCTVCGKVFRKQHELSLHKNIHLFECPFKCEDCQLSFRTQVMLDKHRRSETHLVKVNLNQHFGKTSRKEDPRPFKCEDCQIAFRSHGHLAKHLRSRMHILQLESSGKVPAGTAAQMEGRDLKDLSTLDCDTNLESIQQVLEASTTSVATEHKDSEGAEEGSERVTVEFQKAPVDIGHLMGAATATQHGATGEAPTTKTDLLGDPN